jgi:hypothetical protein
MPSRCSRRGFLRNGAALAGSAAAGPLLRGPFLFPPAPEVPRLLAARPGAFKPVTLEEGRPKFTIPEGSRLARNEHPRLLLVKEDLETMKKRLLDPRVAREYEALRKQCREGRGARWESWNGVCSHALLWKLTGDRTFLDAVKSSPEFRQPTWIFGWPATMDLLWDDLAPEERRDLSDRVAKAVSRDGSLFWRPTLHVVSVFYEGGQGPHDAVFLERMKRDFQETLVRWTDKLNAWAAGRGGSDMSHGYQGEHAYWEPFVAAIGWSHSTGEDYLARADFSRYQSPFYWYHFVPEPGPLCVEKIGVTRTADDSGAVTPSHSGANHLLFLTFTRERDGLGIAWMERFRSEEPAWNRDREALGRVLWGDPDLAPLDPATLPTTRLFPTSGHVVMRSDWTEGATFATFRCGRFGEIDGAWGRNNADNLSFTIRKKGPLAIDSGPVHGQNPQHLKFLDTAGGDSQISSIGNYGRQTIAHNSITIGAKEYVHLDGPGKPSGTVARRGGQCVLQAKEWWARWGFQGPQEDFAEGRVTAYRTHPLYDYACGDAFHSYPPGMVDEITRQFLYLKPDTFVVYDRIVVADPAEIPCWMLHSLREPRASGREGALTPEEIGPQFLKGPGEKGPHPSPGGHFRMEGDGFSVESGSPGKAGGGWLAARTLFPPPGDCERRKIGGKGHEFEVAGVQYGVSEEGYQMADGEYAVRSTIGLLGWRVELRPKAPARAVEFLHVLRVGLGAPPPGAPAAELSSSAETHTVTLSEGGRTFTVRLARTGPRGGAVKAAEGARTLFEGALPGGVEDHWRHYGEDPRFRAWVTDPRYRTVINPAEEDRKRAR